jgi:hypothetical protein
LECVMGLMGWDTVAVWLAVEQRMNEYELSGFD